jgi:hypothetical protein
LGDLSGRISAARAAFRALLPGYQASSILTGLRMRPRKPARQRRGHGTSRPLVSYHRRPCLKNSRRWLHLQRWPSTSALRPQLLHRIDIGGPARSSSSVAIGCSTGGPTSWNGWTTILFSGPMNGRFDRRSVRSLIACSVGRPLKSVASGQYVTPARGRIFRMRNTFGYVKMA